MTLITDTATLRSFCEAVAQDSFVTVDTEFMREKTYYSKLCLIQVGGAGREAAIDPLAQGLDLAPLFSLMDNPGLLKVFHAARQDVEIFVNLTGRIPAPLFDTQVAAMVCGFGEAASYETLAQNLANAKIDKTSRFTDWSRRPLTAAQTTYALADVTHLRKVYEALASRLEKTGRADWMTEEMATLTDPDTYHPDPRNAWQRIKGRLDKPRQLAVLRELAAWREEEARRADVPRARIVKDEILVQIAAHPPETAAALNDVRGVPSGFAQGRLGKAILDAVAQGLALPREACPVLETSRARKTPSVGALLDLLKVLLHQVSEDSGVAARLIASADDLERLAREDAPEIKTLTGWRLDLFGKTALSLKRGELALSVNGGKIQTISRPRA